MESKRTKEAEMQVMTTEEIRAEIRAIFNAGDADKVVRAAELAAELQQRDEPIEPRTGTAYGIPKPDKTSIGFTWDNAGYVHSGVAERAYWILARKNRNPTIHYGNDMTWVKYRA